MNEKQNNNPRGKKKTMSFSMPGEWVFEKIFGPSFENIGKKLGEMVSLLWTSKKRTREGYYTLRELLENNQRTYKWKRFLEKKTYFQSRI